MHIDELLNTTTFNGQDPGEERANSVAHGIGAFLALVAGSFLVAKAFDSSDPVTIFAAIFYSVTLVELFLMSALYHSRPSRTPKEIRVKRVFQVLDHCSVFFLILGTYTPIALSLIGGTMGPMIWIFNIACTVIGVVANAIDLNRWHKWSLLLYIVMGWSALPAFSYLLDAVTLPGFTLILGGGIFYTLGVILYIMPRPRYMHFLWHICVGVGAALHYAFIYIYVV